MTNKDNILQRLHKLDLTDEELNQLDKNLDLQKELSQIEKAESIAYELFVPGYTAEVSEKYAQISKWIDGKEEKGLSSTLDEDDKTLVSEPKTIAYKLIGVAAAILLLAAIIIQPWQSELTHEEKSEELKRFALLSFESSGLLSGERGDREIDLEFKQMYDMLKAGDCDAFRSTGKYPEQELWGRLYCAWSSGNEDEYLRIKQNIIDNKYPKYEKLSK